MWWRVIFYLVLNFGVVWYFWRCKKTLTPYEAVGNWLLTIIYRDDWLTIVSINLHLIETTKNFYLGLIFSLNRVLLFPCLCTLFVDHYVKQRTVRKQVTAFVRLLLMLLLMDYSNRWMGMYQPIRWRLAWSVLVWTALGLFLIGGHAVFRNLSAQGKARR